MSQTHIRKRAFTVQLVAEKCSSADGHVFRDLAVRVFLFSVRLAFLEVVSS